jgi:hypothetical protein
MPPFYTVDRRQTLHQGFQIELVKYNDINPPELQVHVDEMFPEGVSSHGEFYFLRNSSHHGLANPSIELVFEYVRRAKYPDRPSRFQSIFAFELPQQAAEFRRWFGSGQGVIGKYERMNTFAQI